MGLRQTLENILHRFLGMNRPQRTNTFYFLESYKQKPDPKDTSETAHWTQFAYEQNLLIQQHWRELFHEELGEMPITLTAAAGGQFAATKKSLTRHPRKFYQVPHPLPTPKARLTAEFPTVI